MAAPAKYAPHTLVSFGGKLGIAPSQDAWQCGVRIMQARTGADWHDTDTDASLSNPALYMTRLAAGLKAWFTRAAVTAAGSEFMGLRGDATLEWLKVNNITGGLLGKGNPGGKYANQGTSNVYTYTSPVGAGSVVGVASNIPPFVTVAVSFTTDKTRGRGHRGRIYLPLGFTSQNTGRINGSQIPQALGTAKALLDALNAANDQASNGTDLAVDAVVAGIDGTLNLIRGISVGDVYDVQRRRKEQLVETYTSSTYSP